MRMQPIAPASRKPAPKTETPVYLRTLAKPALGDSVEVMELYYRERIQSFTQMLEHLNLMEDAPEITFLCREIIECRTKLARLAVSRKVCSGSTKGAKA